VCLPSLLAVTHLRCTCMASRCVLCLTTTLFSKSLLVALISPRLAINSLKGMISIVIGLYSTTSLLAYVWRAHSVHYAWLLLWLNWRYDFHSNYTDCYDGGKLISIFWVSKCRQPCPTLFSVELSPLEVLKLLDSYIFRALWITAIVNQTSKLKNTSKRQFQQDKEQIMFGNTFYCQFHSVLPFWVLLQSQNI
jgi:hypothetical protein